MRTHSLDPGEEVGDNRAETRDIDQESVVALRRWQRCEGNIRTPCRQPVGELFLLLQREQDVGFHADHPPAWRCPP